MGWGCYKHEIDMGSETEKAKLLELCEKKLQEKPRTWGRDEAICSFCWEEMEAALRSLCIEALAVAEDVEEVAQEGLEEDTWEFQLLMRAADRLRKVGGEGVSTKPRPQIITLCGSSRFTAEMAVIAWGLEKEGNIVFGLHLLPAPYSQQPDHQAEFEGVAAQMNELHRRKIDMSDRILVVNIGGYIGEDTRREIEYTRGLGKPVVFLEKVAEGVS